jgi:AraC family transcriptional activator of pobA
MEQSGRLGHTGQFNLAGAKRQLLSQATGNLNAANAGRAPLSDFERDLRGKGFHVYQIDGRPNRVRTYNRKGFYKICLFSGRSVINYADRGMEIDGCTLFFGNPHVPYSWEVMSESHAGYTCLFSEEFLRAGGRSESLQESPLFKVAGTPIFHIEKAHRDFLAGLFDKMIVEQDTDYRFKGDLIRNYVNLLIHEAMKLQPSEDFFKQKNGAERIASLFLDLLERQFPIETAAKPLQLKSAQDYANCLAIHVNHLNRSVKLVTGKSTSAHIAERIAAEAKVLLMHTDWPVSEIADALGFEYVTYFNYFFKKIAGTIPSAHRLALA